MFQENGFKLIDFIHMEELSSLLLYICIRTEQSQHQIFGIRTEQNETQNTCKRKYMSEILDNKILRLLNILMTKTRFPSKVENITFSWSCFSMTMRCANTDSAAETHRIEPLWIAHTQDSTTQDPKRAYMYIYIYGGECSNPLSIYIIPILFLIRPPMNSFHIFFFYQTSLSHKLIQFIQDSQPSFFF